MQKYAVTILRNINKNYDKKVPYYRNDQRTDYIGVNL